ncbi:MAG: substrate-binding domain-containing protein [Solirubrobacteraceae bacterium]|jgi:rhamnose transport system substrate-binding protein
MLPKFTGIPPFTQADDGAKQLAATFGYNLSYGGPTTASATQQVSFVNTAVAQGDKGIFISADNPAAVTPALVRAEARGVKVVSFDSDVLPAGRSIYVQGTSASSIAATELNMLGSQIGYKGSFAILSAQATDSNQVQWNKILVQDLKTIPKYKNMTLVTIVNPPDDGTPSAVQYTQSLLKEHPTIKGIIAPTTVAVAAAAQVVKQQGLCSKYVVTGLGDPAQMKSFVTSGCVKQFALWGFTKEGQVAMCAMHALLTGAVTGKEGQSFTCGNLGSYPIGAQGTVTAGPATVFSKANLSAFTF